MYSHFSGGAAMRRDSKSETFTRTFGAVLLQEYRSEKTLEELTKLVPPKCHWCASLHTTRTLQYSS